MKDLKPLLTARKFELRDLRCEWLPMLQAYEARVRVYTEERGEVLVTTYSAKLRIDSRMPEDYRAHAQRDVVHRVIRDAVDSVLLLDGKPLERKP